MVLFLSGKFDTIDCNTKHMLVMRLHGIFYEATLNFVSTINENFNHHAICLSFLAVSSAK